MKKQVFIKLIVFLISLTLFISLCGCNENLRWYPVYKPALVCGLAGTIIGHQYDKDGIGTVVGGIVGSIGSFLKQADELKETEKVTLNVTNNESKTIQVALKYKDGFYI